MNKIWPIIWKASPESGKLPGREGYAASAHKQIVTVTFSPHDPILYREVVWIEVYRGRGCRLILEGEGTEGVTLSSIVDQIQQANAPLQRKDSKKKSTLKKT